MNWTHRKIRFVEAIVVVFLLALLGLALADPANASDSPVDYCGTISRIALVSALARDEGVPEAALQSRADTIPKGDKRTIIHDAIALAYLERSRAPKDVQQEVFNMCMRAQLEPKVKTYALHF